MMETSNQARILIVDDHEADREILRLVLGDNYECSEVESAEKAIEVLHSESFNLVISDIRMSGMSGIELVPLIAHIAPDTIVVMISGLGNIESAIKAMRVGAFDYITKPFEFEQVELIVRRALNHQSLRIVERGSELEKFKLASIVESSNDAILSQNFEGQILSWNKAAERIFGYTAEEIIGQNNSLMIPEEKRDTEEKILDEIQRGENLRHYETERIRKNGKRIPVSLSVSPIKNNTGEIIGVSRIVRDLSEDKRVSNNLLQEKLFNDATINSLPGIFYLIDEAGKFLRWNKNFEQVSGYTAEEISTMHPLDFFADGEKPVIKQRIKDALTKGEAAEEADFISKNGNRTPHFFTGKQIEFDGKHCIIGVGIDVSHRKKTEGALHQSQERYRAFIEQSTEGIWRFEISPPLSINLPVMEQMRIISRNSNLAECNNAMAQQYGFTHAEELLGKSISDFLVDDDPINDLHLRAFIESDYHLDDTETIETDKHGHNKYFLNNLVGILENDTLIRIWGTQRDITLAKQTEQAFMEAEKERRQSQKIEAIGRLAGGVAHDFNNFLAVIMLHVDMLNLQLPADSPLRYRVSEIKSVTENAAGMVRQLLAFSRKQPMQPHPIVLNQVVKEFTKILRSLIGADIELRLNLAEDLGVCFVDHNQVTQILMNLAVNARDAMPKGGVIHIETSNMNLEKRSVEQKVQPLGAYVELSISDNGTGIDSKIQERIFEPFFTTKEIGKGTGLGLATVYGIVKQSNGFIWVSSQLDEGTTFKIQFPRIDQAAETVKTDDTSMTIPHGTGTILLVEDEELIRRAAVEVLSNLGYQVFEASNGTQAIQLAEIFTKPIDLLITDVVMPRMNGKDVANKIKSLHPETSVLFISGYTDDIIAQHGILEENIHFLSKPFSHQALAIKVHEALNPEND